jgi:signal transduction histidine kinase
MMLDRVSGPNEVNLRIDVTDTGIGMGKDDLQYLFKPFSQVDQSITKRFGGTGCMYWIVVCRLAR